MKRISVEYTVDAGAHPVITTRVFEGESIGYAATERLARFWVNGITLILPIERILKIEVEETTE